MHRFYQKVNHDHSQIIKEKMAQNAKKYNNNYALMTDMYQDVQNKFSNFGPRMYQDSKRVISIALWWVNSCVT